MRRQGKEFNHKNGTSQTQSDLKCNSQLNESLSYYIGTLQQAPKYIQDELQYIKAGYRINFTKKRQVLRSLFMWHNELVNIWTHLLGALFTISLIFYISSNYSQIWKDKALDEINYRFQNLYEELSIYDGMFNDKLGSSFNQLTEMKDKFRASVDDFSIEHFMSDETREELEDIRSSFFVVFNDWSMNDQIEILKAFSQYQLKMVLMIRSQDFNWINLYQKLTNKSEEDFQKEKINTDISKWPIYAFLVSALTCLLCSSLFHTFFCMSHSVNKILIRMDYAGICFLISGSTYAPFFYGFYCNQFYAIVYIGLNCVTCLAVFVVSLFDFIHTLEYRPLKGKMYAALGAQSLMGSIHLMIASDDLLQGYTFTSQLTYYLLVAFAYLGGLMIFQLRWPENKRTGKYDNCGHSHQLWHIAVVIGISLTYMGTLKAYYARIDQPCISY